MIRKTFLAVLCFIAAVSASAQFVITPTNTSVTGTVSGIDGTRVLLFDNRLVIDASEASVRSDFGPAKLSDIKPGDLISAAVTTFSQPGAFKAVALQIESQPAASIAGSVEGLDLNAGTMRIAGQTIRITASTAFRRTTDGAPASVTELRPLQRVYVELDRNESGLAAKTVAFAPNVSASGSMSARLTAISGDRWTF